MEKTNNFRRFIFASVLTYGLGMSILSISWAFVDYAMLVGVVKANGNPDIELRHRLNALGSGGYFLMSNIISLMAFKEL